LEEQYQRRQIAFVLTSGEGDGIPAIDFQFLGLPANPEFNRIYPLLRSRPSL
jgi:hypothetical protein